MTLAKTCHASSMMQEATRIAITKAVRIAMFQLFHYWSGRKLNLILKLKVAMLNEYITYLLHIVLLQILSGIPFCQILFKLVFISHGYHESPRGELILKHSVVVETLCEHIILFFLVKISWSYFGTLTVCIKSRFSTNIFDKYLPYLGSDNQHK